MSGDDRLSRIADRLDELAALLRDPGVESERAAALAAESAELAAEAGLEVDRERRSSAEEPRAGQEELL